MYNVFKWKPAIRLHPDAMKVCVKTGASVSLSVLAMSFISPKAGGDHVAWDDVALPGGHFLLPASP